MSTKILRYKKENNYSYTLGIRPTLELLSTKPSIVSQCILSSDSKESQSVKKILEFCEKQNIPHIIDDKTIRRISPKENAYAIGVFNIYDSEIQKDQNTIVLINPSSFGNVGTIMRTMVGFDVYNLAIIKPAIDIFNPEVVRASMGALFRVNFQYFDSFDDYQKLNPSKPCYIFSLDGEELNSKTTLNQPFTFVFGNEGEGVTKDILKYGKTFKIPMSEKIDSYNLAVSVGIGLFFTTLKL